MSPERKGSGGRSRRMMVRKRGGVFSYRRRGFVISPRIAFPVLLVVVLGMFIVFVTMDGGAVSTARIVGTVLVSIALIVMFGILALISRLARERTLKEEEEEGAAAAQSIAVTRRGP
jgi:ABC-type dipeptide/oligopeptide/nickel transport system permease subunit